MLVQACTNPICELLQLSEQIITPVLISHANCLMGMKSGKYELIRLIIYKNYWLSDIMYINNASPQTIKCELKSFILKMSHLLKPKLLIHKKGKNETSSNKKIMTKSVKIFIIWPPHDWMHPHIPNNCQRACYKNHLHHSIIDRYEVRE